VATFVATAAEVHPPAAPVFPEVRYIRNIHNVAGQWVVAVTPRSGVSASGSLSATPNTSPYEDSYVCSACSAVVGRRR
jgi:hypothetical protein